MPPLYFIIATIGCFRGDDGEDAGGARAGGGDARVEEVARECDPQDVTNLMVAYATMGRKPGEGVLGALDARAVCLPTHFGADDITLIKWAHATIGTGLSN